MTDVKSKPVLKLLIPKLRKIIPKNLFENTAKSIIPSNEPINDTITNLKINCPRSSQVKDRLCRSEKAIA